MAQILEVFIQHNNRLAWQREGLDLNHPKFAGREHLGWREMPKGLLVLMGFSVTYFLSNLRPSFRAKTACLDDRKNCFGRGIESVV